MNYVYKSQEVFIYNAKMSKYEKSNQKGKCKIKMLSLTPAVVLHISSLLSANNILPLRLAHQKGQLHWSG